ncbi:MAG: hypothetical protein UDQ48_03755, partial [Dialister sp.]|uniref:hypothetical protein n=1 Tax=Dialister sp. TaxID=1955814 RepID=UPI002E7722F8
GGHNLRPGGPSTFLVTTLLYNLRRQPRPFFIKLAAKPPPPLLNPLNLLNLLHPGREVALKIYNQIHHVP